MWQFSYSCALCNSCSQFDTLLFSKVLSTTMWTVWLQLCFVQQLDSFQYFAFQQSIVHRYVDSSVTAVICAAAVFILIL